MQDDALRTVLEYREMGIATIPLAARAKVPPKGFRWKRWQREIPTETDLRTWFQHTDFNIGIVCGQVSGGLAVRDFDDMKVYENWAQQQPRLAATLPTVETGRPGRHVYFRTAERHGVNVLADGELRGEGAYVVAPGSIHPSGFRYSWMNPLTFLRTVEPVLMGVADVAHMSCVDCVLPVSVCPVTTDDAVLATLPTDIGQRNRRLFELARHLKGIIPDAGPDELRRIVQNWHKLARPIIRTKSFDTTWTDFRRAWQQVKHPVRQPRWTAAVQLAERIDLPAIASRYDSDEYRRLVRLCLALHQVHGGGQFPLACRVAGEYLGVAFRTASEMIKTLVFDRVLTVASKRMQSGRWAYEYRYVPGPKGEPP
jgi:hypothetical protein